MMRKKTVVHWALMVLCVLAPIGVGLPTDAADWEGRLYPRALAQQSNRVGLVVRFDDGSLVTRCIEFSEQEISGYDVLSRSGLNVVTSFDSGQGAAVCAIQGEGCSVEECLTCAYPDYWSYWHLQGESWAYSGIGASAHKVHDGDVEGWSWGAGDAPPAVPFDQICTPLPTDTPPPTDTPLPTDTPVPPTATSPPPTDTLPPEPTDTSVPPTPAVWFRLDDNPISAGSCTTVRWDTTGASEVYLDGERVDIIGSRDACPTASQEYQLRVVGAGGERTDTLVLGVTGALPSSTPTSELSTSQSSSSSSFSSPSPTPPPVAVASPTHSPTDAVYPPDAVDPPPALQPTAHPSSLPVSTSEPTANEPPSPSATVQRVALLWPSPSPNGRGDRAPTPSSDSGAVQSTTDDGTPSTLQRRHSDGAPSLTSLVGYATFNLTLIGLLSWLIVKLLRRR